MFGYNFVSDLMNSLMHFLKTLLLKLETLKGASFTEDLNSILLVTTWKI